MPEPEELQDVIISSIPSKAPFLSKIHPLLYQPKIDRDLRLLISWCSADDEADRPSLGDLLKCCELVLREHTEAYYNTLGRPLAVLETDSNVTRWVKNMILNPIVDDDDIDIE